MNADQQKAMRPGRINLRAYRDPTSYGPERVLLYCRVVRDGIGLGRSIQAVETPTLRELQEGECTLPLLNLDESEAQTLMNTLWECGIRPAAFMSAGRIEACDKHLADLRHLLFHVLKVKDQPQPSTR